MIGCKRVRLRISSCMDVRRRFRSSVITDGTYFSDTAGCSTATIVCDVYFFGRTSAVPKPIAPKEIVISGNIQPKRRAMRFTSAKLISPFRTITPHSSITSEQPSYVIPRVPEMRAESSDPLLAQLHTRVLHGPCQHEVPCPQNSRDPKCVISTSYNKMSMFQVPLKTPLCGRSL